MVAESAAASALSRKKSRIVRVEERHTLVVLREPVHQHPAAERDARAARDAWQLRSERRSKRALYARQAPRRRVSLVRGAGSRTDIRKVKLEYHGRHQPLFQHVTPADVIWICDRLAALSDRQLEDAFRAGGYPKSLADRFIRRLKQKIAEGRALKDRNE